MEEELYYKGEDSILTGPLDEFLVVVCRDQYYRYLPFAANFPDGVEAVQFRHSEVGDDQIGGGSSRQLSTNCRPVAGSETTSCPRCGMILR